MRSPTLVFALLGLMVATNGCDCCQSTAQESTRTPTPTNSPSPSPTWTPTATPTATHTATPAQQEEPSSENHGDDQVSTTPVDLETEETDLVSSRNVAVLISTDVAENGLPGNAGFWYDTVLQYCMLRKNGFSPENIYVLYGDGRDGFYIASTAGETGSGASPGSRVPTGQSAAGGGQGSGIHNPAAYYEPPYCVVTHISTENGGPAETEKISDFPMMMSDGKGIFNNTSRPEQFFECLASGCNPRAKYGVPNYTGGNLQAPSIDGFLYVWWRGHGTVSTASGVGRLNLTVMRNDRISAENLIEWISKIEAKRRLLVFETCNSGCISHDVDTSTPESIVFASSLCLTPSNGYNFFEGDVSHAIWSFWMTAILMGETPNQSSNKIQTNSGEIEIQLSLGGDLNEAFCQSTVATALQSIGSQNPKKVDSLGLAGSTTVTGETTIAGLITGQSRCTPTPTPPPI
jgi:hypothetical protein